jgi:hypothetical protein
MWPVATRHHARFNRTEATLAESLRLATPEINDDAHR